MKEDTIRDCTRSVVLLACILLLWSSCSSEQGPQSEEQWEIDVAAFQFTDTLAIDTIRTQGHIPDDVGCVFYDSVPAVIHRVHPQYPESLLHLGERTAKVWVKAFVDSTGRVICAFVLKSDSVIYNGYTLRAAVQWRFTPAILRGRKYGAYVTIPFSVLNH